MKKKLPILFSVAMLFPLSALLAQSVVIEGGPDTIQISDRDGKPEPIDPTRVTGPDAVTADEPANPGGLRPPVTPVTDRPLSPRPAPGPVMGPAGSTVVPAPASPPRTLAVSEAKRLAELKRELNIHDTGTNAALSLGMENVFVAGGATIDPVAVDRLTLLAEYLVLALAGEINLTYHYAPNLHDKDLAWARSVAMIKWMTEKGGLAESTFTIRNPEIVTEPAPASTAEDADLATMQNRLAFDVIFR
jgi:hypothetical protein